MDLKIIFYFISLLSLTFGASIKNKRSTSDEDYEAWLTELESQIITESNGLQTTGSTIATKKPKTEVPDYLPGTLEGYNEPIVVTAKPYLTGGESKDEESVTEKDEVHANSESGNRDPSDEKGESHTSVDNNGRKIKDDTPFLTLNTQDEDNQKGRKILDKILQELPNIRQNSEGKHSSQFSNNENVNTGSEVRTFVVLVKNRTPMIILGCILSLLTLLASVVTVCQVFKNLNTNSSIMLVAHYEYDESISSPLQKNLTSA